MSTISTPKKWTVKFLDALAECGNVTKAAKSARIDRKTAYNLRGLDTTFAEAWDAALEYGVSGLEDEARRRAFEGTKKPIYQQGKLVGYQKEYSDTLLIFLLKAHRPDKYRETTRNLNINVTPEQAAAMSDDDLDAELKRRGLA